MAETVEEKVSLTPYLPKVPSEAITIPGITSTETGGIDEPKRQPKTNPIIYWIIGGVLVYFLFLRKEG
jgi:hypothetical protein